MEIKKILCFCALALSVLGLKAQTPQMLPVDDKVRIGKLDNGLTYYIRHNEEPKGQAAFCIAHKVGSVQEEDNQRGLAHFLEHMAFNGSKHFPAGDVFSFIQRIGVTQFNAYTAFDETYYHLDNTPVTNPLVVDSCMLLLSDWSCGVQLTQSEIEKERDVIHGEYRQSDNATSRLQTSLYPKVYAGCRYGERMPIGTMEVIDNFSPQFLKDYYNKWYHPDLQAVIVVGDIDVDAIEAKVKELFSGLKNPKDEAPYEIYTVPDNEKAIYAIGSDKEQQMMVLNLNFKREMTPFEYRGTVDYLLADYVTTIACNIINERLADIAIKGDCPFLAANVSDGRYLNSKSAEALNVIITPKPGQSKEAAQVVMTELARAKQHGFTPSELQRANEEYMSQIESLYNNREKMSNAYFTQQYLQNFLYSNPIPSIETIYQLAQQVVGNLDPQVFSSIFNAKTPSTEQNFVAMVMCPENDVPAEADLKAAVDAGFNAQTEAFVDEASNEPLIAELPTPVKIKKEEQAPFGYTKWTLKNGANVYFKKTDFSDDDITMNAFSKGGYDKLGDEYAPLAAIFHNPNSGQEFSFFDAVINGTGTYGLTSTQLRKKLAGKNASVSPAINNEFDMLNGGSTVKDLRTLFELTYLVFQGPSNDPDGYNAISEKIKTVMPQLDAMHSIIQLDSLRNTYYKHNPRIQLLHASTIEKTNYAMVQKALADRFKSAGDFDFVFSGPIDVDSLRAYVEQYIAPMPGVKKREVFTDVKLEFAKGVVENVYPCKMQSADASESIINVRWTAEVPTIDLKQSAIVRALGSILGDRYFRRIREEGSMGYIAGANGLNAIVLHPYLRVDANTNIKPERKDEALAIIYEEMDNIAKNGVTEEELKKYKEPALTNHQQNQRSDGYWNEVLRNKLIWNVDINTDQESIIKNITSDDIKNLVNDYILKQNNRTTVVMMPE